MFSNRLRVLLLATALIPLVPAQDNQCFYAANKRAGSIIVPCSSGPGYSSCCQLGDICLSDSACWNPQYNVTYLYGCTDSTYTDYTCPYKCGASFADAPYVGLDYCYNTTNYEWSCTHPKNSDQAIQPFDFSAQCYDDSIIAFAGPNTLPPYLSLPTSIGGSTLYFSPTAGSYTPVPGYTPTTSALFSASVPTTVEYVASTATTSTTSASSSSPSSTGNTSPTTATSSGSTSAGPTSSTVSSAASSTSPSGSGSPLDTSTTQSSSGSSNTGLKVGLGVGIAGGVLFLAALVLFFLMWHRRRQRHAAIPQHETEDRHYSGVYDPHEEKNTTRYQDSPAMGGSGGGFEHYRTPSELPTENVNTYRNSMNPMGSSNMATSSSTSPVPLYSEFEGSVPTHSSSAGPQRFEIGNSR